MTEYCPSCHGLRMQLGQFYSGSPEMFCNCARPTERFEAIETRQNEIGAALGRIEANLRKIDSGCETYTECILSPMLASLENRIIEQYNVLCTIIGMIEKREKKRKKR